MRWIKGLFCGSTQRTHQMCIFVGHIEVQNDGAGIFRKYDMKLIAGLGGQKDHSIIGNVVGILVDDNRSGYILEEEKPAIVANAGFSLDTKGVFVYAGITDVGI